MRRLIRDTVFRLIRSDIVMFIDDHEDDILKIFREEMEKLDRQIPEENLFIDIRIVPLGEEILHAVLKTMTRMMQEI